MCYKGCVDQPRLMIRDHYRRWRCESGSFMAWYLPRTEREWTRILIPPELISRWVDRTHGEMTFHFAQLLIELGCSNRFLQKIGRVPSDRVLPLRTARRWRSTKEENDVLHMIASSILNESAWSKSSVYLTRADFLNAGQLGKRMKWRFAPRMTYGR